MTRENFKWPRVSISAHLRVEELIQVGLEVVVDGLTACAQLPDRIHQKVGVLKSQKCSNAHLPTQNLIQQARNQKPIQSRQSFPQHNDGSKRIPKEIHRVQRLRFVIQSIGDGA